MFAPNPLKLPLRIVRAACYLGLAEIVALFAFLLLHPLNSQVESIGPYEVMQMAIGFGILAVPYVCLLACTEIVRERRVMPWLLLVPALLVWLTMTWGCFVHAVIAAAAMRAEAAGQRYMNCGGFPWMLEVPLSYLIVITTFSICALANSVSESRLPRRHSSSGS
jgi:hypothetical protein